MRGFFPEQSAQGFRSNVNRRQTRYLSRGNSRHGNSAPGAQEKSLPKDPTPLPGLSAPIKHVHDSSINNALRHLLAQPVGKRHGIYIADPNPGQRSPKLTTA